MPLQISGTSAARFWKLQHRNAGSGGPLQCSYTNFCGATGFYTRCEQVNLLQGCSDSTRSPNEWSHWGPCHVIPVVPVGSPAGFCSPGSDSPLGSQHTGSGSSNKPGISVLVDFANTIQQFFVKIEWLCCRPAGIIFKIILLLLVGDRKQQSDSLIPKVCV